MSSSKSKQRSPRGTLLYGAPIAPAAPTAPTIDQEKTKKDKRTSILSKKIASQIEGATGSSTFQEKLFKIVETKVENTMNFAERVDLNRTKHYSSAFSTAYAKHDHDKFKKTYLHGKKDQDLNIDILYLMDCTGSMSEWINMCKEKVSQIGAIVRETYPSCKLRQAFIGYRDYEDQGAVMTLDFVKESELEKFQDFMKPIQATGGGDTPEDIAPALKEAAELSWASSNKKLIIHFADAPCHGISYHDLSDDDYPRGSPTGCDPCTQLGNLCEYKIDYYFVKVGGGEITDKMVQIFKKKYNSINEKVNFKEFDASDDPQKFLPIVQTSITMSISK